MPAIIVDSVVKFYGKFQALDGISFEVQPGEIFGLIGPNGAGKTTTLRILSTLLRIDAGKAEIFGNDVAKQADSVRKIISYLPEDAGAYKNLTGREYLRFIAKFFVEGKALDEMLAQGVEIADLKERIDDKVEQYSKGMTRRLLVGRALMVEPRLAILDEPTSGLDVINAKEIRRIIKDYASGERAVLLSSHNMLEVEYLCDRVALINKGKIIEAGTPTELKRKHDAANIEDVFTKVVA